MQPIICETSEEFDIQLELAAPHLVRAAEICINEPEVQSNIIRTLSILSEQSKCCDAIAEMASRLGILLGSVNVNSCSPNANGKTTAIMEKTLGVLSRIGYILGNIMARSDTARVQFYNNDVAMECLLSNLELYATNRFTLKKRSANVRDDSTDAMVDCDTVVDVLIKLIRVIANMSINPDVGAALANDSPLGSLLLTLLLTINKFKCIFVSR